MTHMEFADRLAMRYGSGREADDLRQVARTALVSAAERYDPDVGPFRPFAATSVIGELKRHFRQTSWVVKVPRSLQERHLAARQASDRLTMSLRRTPTSTEVATELGCSVDDVVLATSAGGWRSNGLLNEEEGDDVDPLEEVEWRVDLHRAATELDEADRQLLTLRHLDGMTQLEIAGTLGVSQPEIHRRLRALHRRLRTMLDGASLSRSA